MFSYLCWDQSQIDLEIVCKLAAMLDENNTHAKCFRMARDKLKDKPFNELKLKLILNRNKDGRVYNIHNVSKVATLIVGDVDTTSLSDIIMETQSGELQRINELHASYLGYQYPLLFPYGEDDYRHDVTHQAIESSQGRKRNQLTIKEWLCFRTQSRPNKAQTLLRSIRLFQQFLVDRYTMLELEILSFIRRNQSKLRVGKYNNLSQSNPNT